MGKFSVEVLLETNSGKKLPEYHLLKGVLNSGLLDATGTGARGGETSSNALRRRQIKALHWVMSDEVSCSPEKGISFDFICEVLGLDSATLKKRVEQQAKVDYKPVKNNSILE